MYISANGKDLPVNVNIAFVRLTQSKQVYNVSRYTKKGDLYLHEPETYLSEEMSKRQRHPKNEVYLNRKAANNYPRKLVFQIIPTVFLGSNQKFFHFNILHFGFFFAFRNKVSWFQASDSVTMFHYIFVCFTYR